MKITRENYESFFLDYLENNLKVEWIDQFLDFLEQNPDLKEELHLFEFSNLHEDEIIFSGKNQLYKNAADEKSAFENRLIALMEGDLEYPEQQSFIDFLTTQPELQKEYDLFAKTRLIADPAVRYSGKRKLKRRSQTAIVMNWMTVAAAFVLLFWGINSVIPKANQPDNIPQVPKIAETISKPILQIEKGENVKTITETAKDQKLTATNEPKHIMHQTVEPLVESSPAEKPLTDFYTREPDSDIASEISPKVARLESGENDTQLAFTRSEKEMKPKESGQVLTVEEFLAAKAKKVSNEGLLSVQRIARAGLDVASELSGERIGYVEKNGKIKSIEFESKLFAFSIPLKKR